MRGSSALARLGSSAAFVGAFLLLVSTFLHPMGADPNVAVAAFAEYAADALWVWSHLGQFAGVVGLSVALVAFATTFASGWSAAWARMGVVGTAAVVALAAALQAVDGVALKVLVDRWAASSGEARALAFEAAFAVRQVEVGLASLLSVMTGLTLLVFGLAVLASVRHPAWLGWLALPNGVALVVVGALQAATGFSGVAMTLSMVTSVLLLVWVLAVGVLLLRLAPSLRSETVL